MCGICGIISLNGNPVSEVSVRKMMQIQKHRGPDDEGSFIEENIGIGFVRLSIIDLSSAGHQPMLSADNRFVIVFNGEIYNYIELREELRSLGHIFRTNTDTETLLAAYTEWGEDCLNHFNGMWAFAIYDRKERSVFASRDRFGVKPFYYLLTDEIFAFASEIPPLISLLSEKPRPHYQSIFDYLAFNRTDQTDSTFFSEIKKLQHGCNLKNVNGQIKINRWYNLKENVSKADAFSSIDEFRKLFISAVDIHLRSDVPVGVCLSGGLDSSSIVSVLLKNHEHKDLSTFSAVYNKGQIGDEIEFIEEFKPYLANMFFITPTAETLKDDLESFVRAHSEPIPTTSPYAQFKVMQIAKGKVVVTLDGQGADEELAGYHYFFGFYFKDLLRGWHIGKLFKEVYYYLNKHRSLFGIKSLLFFLLSERLRTNLSVRDKVYLNKQFVSDYGRSNNIAANLYGANTLNDALLSHFEYKLEHLLKWEDRNSMWFSLEARVPFLDFRLVERVLACPEDFKIRNGMTKYLLRESMKDIVPEKIRLRLDKIGFDTPQEEWFRTVEWQKIVSDIFASSTFKNRIFIDHKKAMLTYNLHLAGKHNLSREIWKMVNLELWFRQFID